MKTCRRSERFSLFTLIVGGLDDVDLSKLCVIVTACNVLWFPLKNVYVCVRENEREYANSLMNARRKMCYEFNYPVYVCVCSHACL